MKLRLEKIGDVFIAADPVSRERLAPLVDGIYNCTVSKAKLKSVPDDLRSRAQEMLLHGWHEDMSKTQVNEFAGNTAKEWKVICKAKFLFDIYLEFNIMGYQELLAPKIKHYTKSNLELTKWHFAENDFLKTSLLSVGQYRLYLNEIEQFCIQNGIALRTDPKLYGMACE